MEGEREKKKGKKKLNTSNIASPHVRCKSLTARHYSNQHPLGCKGLADLYIHVTVAAASAYYMEFPSDTLCAWQGK